MNIPEINYSSLFFSYKINYFNLTHVKNLINIFFVIQNLIIFSFEKKKKIIKFVDIEKEKLGWVSFFSINKLSIV